MKDKNNIKTCIDSIYSKYTDDSIHRLVKVYEDRVYDKLDSDEVRLKMLEDEEVSIHADISSKIKLAEEYKELMDKKEVQSKKLVEAKDKASELEKKIADLTKQQAELIASIPTLQQKVKSTAFQLEKLIVDQETQLSSMNNEKQTSNEKSDAATKLAESLMDDRLSVDESMAIGDDVTEDLRTLCLEPDRLIQNLEAEKEILEQQKLEAEEKLQSLQSELQKIKEKADQVTKSLQKINDGVKEDRKSLVDCLQKELKDWQCISGLFDYMSRPVLSRDIGVNILDLLLSDLANLCIQITSEANRHKRILKLASKNEDYSHEENLYDDMLSQNIADIKAELNKLNEERIPALKELEKNVIELEVEVNEAKQRLNSILDCIEETEEILINKLEVEVRKGASETAITNFFSKSPTLLQSRYPEYIIQKLFSDGEEGDLRQSVSEWGSNIDSSIIQHDQTEEADNNEDDEFNETIIQQFPKKLISKVLATFSQQYSLFRSVVLNKLSTGIIISKKNRSTKGMVSGSCFDPLKYYNDKSLKYKKTGFEIYGYHKKLIRFDFEAGKLCFYGNKTKNSRSAYKRDDSLLLVNNKWVLEEEIDLDNVQDIVLPECTQKMIKSRLHEFFQPGQFGVYNPAELQSLQSCPYLPFTLDLGFTEKVECIADDLAIFLDLYSGIEFLHHS